MIRVSMLKMDRNRDGFSWDLYTGAILVLFVFFQVMQWPLLPKFLDVYYHLFVMNGFEKAGGYVTQDFWEYAPVGRPHLYPPVLHLWMLLLHRLGLEAITVGRLMDVVLYPLLLWGLSRATKQFISNRASFFVVLLFASSYSAYLAVMTLAPFSLAFLFGLLACEDLDKRRVLRAGLWLGLCFYTHSLSAWIFLATILMYGLANQDYFKESFRVAFIGAVIAAPFLVHQFAFREYFQFLKVKENLVIEIDIFIYAAAILGGLLAFKHKKKYFFPICFLLAHLIILSSHRYRFFSGHGLLAFAWLGGILMDEAYQWIEKRWTRKTIAVALLAFFSWLYLMAPIVQWDLKKAKAKWNFFDRTLTRFILPEKMMNFSSKGFTIYFAKEYNELIQAVKKHSKSGDILWSDFAHGAGLVALLADRVTSSAMLQEIGPYKPIDGISEATLSIWYKDPDNDAGPPKGMREAIAKYDLKPVAETELAYLYKNASAHSKVAPVKPVLTENGIWVLFIVYSGALIMLRRRTQF